MRMRSFRACGGGVLLPIRRAWLVHRVRAVLGVCFLVPDRLIPPSARFCSPGGAVEEPSSQSLWGICALAGSHDRGDGFWVQCAAHAPCECSGVVGPHLRIHPLCEQNIAIRQRADVWPSLSSGITKGNLRHIPAADGTAMSSPDLAWFFGVPSSLKVGGKTITLHVRRARARTRARPLPRGRDARRRQLGHPRVARVTAWLLGAPVFWRHGAVLLGTCGQCALCGSAADE